MNTPRRVFLNPFSTYFAIMACFIASTLPVSAQAQQTSTSSAAATALPRMVRFSGTAKDMNGHPLTGVVGITFALYSEQTGGAALWLETQNVNADGSGHYSVLLGSTKPDGLPADLFNSEQARWVGVQISGQSEQSRTLLVSAPYALKAGDAETIGGLPPSAFMLAIPANGAAATVNTNANNAASSASSSSPSSPGTTHNVTTTGGTVNAIPLFTTSTNIQNSIVTQTGTSAVSVAGQLNAPATGAATKTAGKNSQAHDFVASAFNSGTSTPVAQTFQLQAEPVGNNTATASGTLNLLFGQGTSKPAETGLKISSKGLLTFASGQTFPGTGTITGVTTAAGSGLSGGGTSGTLSLTLLKSCSSSQILKWSGSAWACAADANSGGTVTSITAGTGLTGGTITGSGTIGVNSSVVPELTLNNTFTKTQTLNAGVLTGSTIQAQDGTFAFLMNSVDCCNFGTRMVWAHSPAFPNWGIFYDDNVDFMHIRTQPGGEILTVDFGGLVGINNATPGQALDVNGNINTNSSVLAAGDVDANGNLNASGGVNAGGRGTFGSSSAGGQTLIANNSGGAQALQIQNFTNPIGGFTEAQFDVNGKATFFTDAFGDTTATGTKSAAVALASGEMVKVFSTESPEVWFEDYGFGQLANGSAQVTIDSSFIQTASMIGYHVFVTPKGDCKGLYVTNETNGTFEVRELGGGQSNIAFDYRIVAHRKGYEALRLPPANLPTPQVAKAQTEKPKELLTLPAAKRAPNPQLMYRSSVRTRVQKTTIKK